MRCAPSAYMRGSGLRKPSSPEMTMPSKSSARRSRGERRVPQEFETRPVAMPRSWRARTPSTIASSRAAPAKRRSMSPSCHARPRAVDSRGSKSTSSMRPHSKSTSSARASRSWRKRLARISGSRPSSAQKVRNEPNRSPVITPPQSSRTALRSAATGQRLRARRELDDALPEALEIRVVGGPGDRALVVALHEDDRLPQRQRAIPADVCHRAPGALLVAGDELLAQWEALLAGDAGQLEHAPGRIVAVDPQGAQIAEIGQRVADGGHLPVEDGHEPGGRGRGHHRVAQAVVAVHHGGGSGLRQVRAEPLAHRLDRRDVARAVVLPQAEEAAQLALEVARRLAEALQARVAPVDRVDLDEPVDELFPDAPAIVGAVERVGDRARDDVPVDALHDEEGRADD